MKYYVVIDTNVLVSALMKPESIPRVILEEALSGRIMPLLNGEILDEYEAAGNSNLTIVTSVLRLMGWFDGRCSLTPGQWMRIFQTPRMLYFMQ